MNCNNPILIALIFLGSYLISFSQPVENDIINSENSVNVSFGPVLKPNFLPEEMIFFTGFKSGVTFNGKYYLGIGLYGTTFEKYFPEITDIKYNIQPNLELNYIGFEAEYNLEPSNAIYPTFGIFAGLSLLRFDIPYTEDSVTKQIYEPDYKENKLPFTIEPSVSINLNLKSFYRIGLGVAYRIVLNEDYKYQNIQTKSLNEYVLKNGDLNSLSIYLNIRFGGF